jgi:hypothetical protein
MLVVSEGGEWWRKVEKDVRKDENKDDKKG